MSWLCFYIAIGVCVGLITACFGEDFLSALALFATNIIVWPLTLAVVVMGVCIEAYQWNQSRITYRQVRKLIDNDLKVKRMTNSLRVCTPDTPMPKGDKRNWQHPEAVSIASSCDCCDAYQCPICGTAFKVELPE